MKDEIKLKLSAQADSKCKVCLTHGRINEIFYMCYGASNGIIGPGSHRSNWVESRYQCINCGIPYFPTPNNHLDNGHDERQKKASTLLKGTHPVRLIRKLRDGEVFQRKGQDFIRLHDIYYFTGGKQLRMENSDSERNIRQAMGLGIYIIPNVKDPLKSRVITWGPTWQKKIPLQKSMKKELEKKVHGNDKSVGSLKMASPIDEMLLKNFKNAFTYMEMPSKPLPKNAIKTVMVLSDDYSYEEEFYIPANAYEYVR